MYFIWREYTFQMSTVNLLAAILMPYSIKLFYEHSTLKLWCEILVPQGKKYSFEHFCTRWLKYSIVLKLQITFNSWLNATKSTHYIEKASNKSCSELNFVQNSPWAHMSISPQNGARALERLIWLCYGYFSNFSFFVVFFLAFPVINYKWRPMIPFFFFLSPLNVPRSARGLFSFSFFYYFMLPRSGHSKLFPFSLSFLN